MLIGERRLLFISYSCKEKGIVFVELTIQDVDCDLIPKSFRELIKINIFLMTIQKLTE